MKPRRVLVSLLVAGSLLAVPLASQAVVMGSTEGPDCSGAAASVGTIWPPNHQMVAESIVGVTDSSPFTITITKIEQDEPVETDGSGNTEPDGSGIGTATAYVRAERAGPGTGRIYVISFTATDGYGYSCSSAVNVYVPHDQGQGYTPVFTGNWYSSTQVVD